MKEEIVHSAGAIVLREVDGELKIALAHSPKKDGLVTWVLPKGHVEPDESLEQTVLREVREEVGLSKIQLITYLGVIERLPEKISDEVTTQKRVHLYLAYALDNEPFQSPIDEHRGEAGWFSLSQAIEHIPHEKDRDFLKEHLAPLLKV